MSEFVSKNKNDYINKIMKSYTNVPVKNNYKHSKPIDKTLKVKIEASVNRAVIYAIREIEESKDYTHYVITREQDFYRDLLYGKFPEFNRNNLYQMIENFFIYKNEIYNSEQINKIIELLISHTFIDLWTHLFLSDMNAKPCVSIKLILKKYKIKTQKIYNNLLCENTDIDHECVDYKLTKLKPEHHCIICGYIYCQYVY